jgi:hypothetical protein
MKQAVDKGLVSIKRYKYLEICSFPSRMFPCLGCVFAFYVSKQNIILPKHIKVDEACELTLLVAKTTLVMGTPPMAAVPATQPFFFCRLPNFVLSDEFDDRPLRRCREDGADVPAYLSPETSSGIGIVVIQEWWGVNDQIKQTAADIGEACNGRVAVPDLYRSKIAYEASVCMRCAWCFFSCEFDFFSAGRCICWRFCATHTYVYTHIYIHACTCTYSQEANHLMNDLAWMGAVKDVRACATYLKDNVCISLSHEYFYNGFVCVCVCVCACVCVLCVCVYAGCACTCVWTKHFF